MYSYLLLYYVLLFLDNTADGDSTEIAESVPFDGVAVRYIFNSTLALPHIYFYNIAYVQPYTQITAVPIAFR